jgi:hypothetical protein
VLARINAKGKATTAQMMAFCAAEGMKIAMVTIPGRTAWLVKRGLLARVARGVFKLGPRGAEIVGDMAREQKDAKSEHPKQRRARRIPDRLKWRVKTKAGVEHRKKRS